MIHHLELREEIKQSEQVKRGKIFTEAWLKVGELNSQSDF